MTSELIVLTQDAPHVRAFVGSMLDAGETLRVSSAGEDALIHLCDERGDTLLSVETVQRVDVVGEAERLLGDDAVSGLTVPFWRVTTRASDTHPRASAIARRFAEALVARLGGTVWPAREAPDVEGAR